MGHGQFYEAATLILPLILAIVCHEVAHGYVASLLGDTTARDQGRLTLNPFAHVDPFGTIILPGMMALAHLPVFGWAKPVPVNFWRLRNRRSGMMLVAAAGPGSNLLLAALAAVALGLLVRFGGEAIAPDQPINLIGFTFDNCQNFLGINLFLALFNLLPVPPFDGSHILEGMLPRPLAERYASMRQYGMLLVMALLLLPPLLFKTSLVMKLLGGPFDWLYAHYIGLAQWVAVAV